MGTTPGNVAKLATHVAADTRPDVCAGTIWLGLLPGLVALSLWSPHGTIVVVVLIASSVAVGRSLRSEAWSGCWVPHSSPGIDKVLGNVDSLLEGRGLPLANPGTELRTGVGAELLDQDQILDRQSGDRLPRL